MTVPQSEIEAQIARVRTALTQNQIDCAIIVQYADLFYLAGTQPNKATFWCRQAENRCCWSAAACARAESPLAQVESFTSLRSLPNFLKRLGVSRVGTD